jgi:uncharacterized RDD family membrane protein YckC
MIHAVLGGMLRMVVRRLYYSLLESSAWQGTLGKGAQAGRPGSTGTASASAAHRRFLRKSFPHHHIGYIMAGFTEKKQALHDILADTLVINLEKQQCSA